MSGVEVAIIFLAAAFVFTIGAVVGVQWILANVVGDEADRLIKLEKKVAAQESDLECLDEEVGSLALFIWGKQESTEEKCEEGLADRVEDVEDIIFGSEEEEGLYGKVNELEYLLPEKVCEVCDGDPDYCKPEFCPKGSSGNENGYDQGNCCKTVNECEVPGPTQNKPFPEDTTSSLTVFFWGPK